MTRLRKYKAYIIIFALTVTTIGGALGAILYQQNLQHDREARNIQMMETSRVTPVSFSPIIEWEKDINAVFYEVEFFTSRPLYIKADSESPSADFRSRRVYQNRYNPPLEDFAGDVLGSKPVYWRVRSMDFDGKPLTAFSKLQELWTSADIPPMNAPLPVTEYSGANGHVLLYPVYHWVQQAKAKSYEIALYDDNPVSNPAAATLAVLQADMSELYDTEPRPYSKGFYWRVRSFDENGQPLGSWSEPQYYRASPEDRWEVGVLGDSISHGGGHFSFGPADFEFSYLSYLSFPTINLSESGDTAKMTLNRFDRDVLPFHPRYLLIMTGSNSLRAGEDPQGVIECLKEIQRRCIENDIRPILLTLPAINPDNIQHIFQEGTAPDWQLRFAAVNAYIRTQVHIDTAAAINSPGGLLPTKYGLDGLHPDASGKKLMGERINADWPGVKLQADKLLLQDEED
ncbi:MAG: GDSL family lipase [Selenomonas sp.]|nr:GDSL family lipase [Selenomonas sp.]